MSTPTIYASEFKAFKGKNYRENQRSAVDKQGYPCDETSCCILCGKHVRTTGRFVFLTNVGEYTDMETGSDQLDALGLYPVGSDCAKKLKGIPMYNANNEKVGK